MKKLLSLLLSACILTVLFAGCQSKKASSKSSKLKVVVSFNAMREFAKAVGGKRIDIDMIIPNGTEPHDYEPKASDLKKLENAKVFIYNGFNMESWKDKTLKSIENKDLIKVEATKGIEPIKNTDEGEIKEHGQYDPHAWIGLKEAEIEVKNIKDVFVKADSANKEYYEKNCSDYINKIEDLYNTYKTKFDAVGNKKFVTGHAAFGYLCRDFGMSQDSVEDVFADGEPTAAKMKNLVDYCKKNNIKTIFTEDLASPKISKTLADEVGGKFEKIYTIESNEDNKDYIECMKYNLEKIYKSFN